MKSNLFLPYGFKRLGWIMLLPGLALGLAILILQPEMAFFERKVFAIYSSMVFQETVVMGMVETNILDEIIGAMCLLGAIFVAFSKEKNEDEFIAKIRLESLLIGTYINFGMLLFCMMFFFDFAFLMVMIVNIFTMLLFTIARYYLQLSKLRKSLSHEE
jgi:hypothetical protein